MKYYPEIESNFFLSVNDERNINHDLDDSKLPKCFFERYRDLIEFIPKIKELFEKILLDNYCNNQNYSQFDKNYLEFLLQMYKREYLSISSTLKENLTLFEIKNSIQYWGNILDFMFMIDNTLFEKTYFISMMKSYNSALIDIGSIDGSAAKKYLPDKWLLTSRGYLYNMQSTAHEAGFYSDYYLEKINWFFDKTEPYIRKKNPFSKKIDSLRELSDTSIILKNEFVKWNTLDLMLHFIDYYHFNYKIYDSKTITILTGMIELRQDLFDFFEKLELYTDSPKDNLRKVIEITNNNYLDVLVRCCGVTKITSSPYKTIITSSLTAKIDFREYLDKGFNICFLPPIIINRKTRRVEELNMNSSIVSSYIKNEVIYEDELSRRKVYTNHIIF